MAVVTKKARRRAAALKSKKRSIRKKAATKAAGTRAANRRKKARIAKRRKAQAGILPIGWKNPMGMPWWIVLGGVAAAYFLFRKPAVAAPTSIPALMPKPPVQQVVDPEDPSGSGNYVF